jgi:hypothetical protein
MTPEEQEARLRAESAAGTEAERILNNPLFVDAVAKIKDGIQRQFLNCPVDETGNQPRLFCQAKMDLLNTLVKELKSVMNGGKAATQDVVHLESERKKRATYK